jgi:iron transport multicopper oxidase
LFLDPEDPQKRLYDVDDETTVITLSDYFHTSARTLSQIAHTKGGAEPVPDSGLINGKGRYNGGPLSDWAVVDVTSSQRYRFRVINMSAGAA